MTQTAQSIHVLRTAHKLGYRITKAGIALGPNFNVLRTWPCKSPRGGYLIFQIRLNGKKQPIKVHRLQAYQKYGEKVFEKYLEVRHENSNKMDNTWDNILLGTHSANMMDVPREVRVERAINANNLRLATPY